MRLTYSYLISAIAALGGFLFGFDTAIINGALLFLKQEFRLSDVSTEFAAGSLLGGCVAGTAIAGTLADRFGRKLVLLASAALFAIAAIGAAVPKDLTSFVIARILGGVAIGLVSTLVPLYIAEVSPAAQRGRMVSLYQFAIVIGILAAYGVSALLASSGQSSWRWMFASAAAPSAIFFCALFAVPESPRWLVQQGRITQALAILGRLEGLEFASGRINEIRDAVSAREPSISELFQPIYRPALVIGVGLACLCQITGINTILYYGAIIFTEQAGAATAKAALIGNIIIGGVNLLATILTLAVIDSWGRKKLLLWSSAGMAVSLALLGIAIKLGLNYLVALTCVLTFVAFFAIGMGPVIWVIMSEIFPTGIRGRAISLATVVLWSSCLLVTVTFLSLVKELGPAGTFWLYSGLSLVSFLFIMRSVPETKGRTLEQIQSDWRQRTLV